MKDEFGPLLMSLGEAATLLNVSPVTVWRLARRGEIRSVKLGKRVLVPRSELERLVGEAVA